MSLLNAVLAWGALAFTVPLAIHLLFRTRFRTLDWGAMFLLTGAARINQRRMQWLQWLLLMLRCAIPVLLALAMARPLIQGQLASSSELPQSLVLVFDDSRSMDTRDAKGDSVLDQSKQATLKLLSELTRRDEVVLIRSSRLDVPASISDRGRAEQRIREIEALGGPFSLDEGIRSAVEALSRTNHPDRRIVVVSDFQDRDVAAASSARMKQLAERIESSDARTTVSFLKLTESRDSIANVSVDAVRMESSAAIVGRMTEFVVELRNAADETAAAVPLRWSLDGQVIETKPLDVPPRGSQFVRFRRRFQDPGLHEVTFSIDLDDALPSDNRRSLAVDALPAMEVVVIDGKPSRRPLQGTADFLLLALQPELEDQSVAAKFLVNRVSPTLVASGARSLRRSLVVVCNVALDAKLKSKLADHVLSGGTVVVFDGDRVNPELYNSSWIGRQGQWEFPLLLGERVAPEQGVEASQDDGVGIGRIDPDFSAWALLTEKDDQPLADVIVNQFRMVRPRRSSTDSDVGQAADATTEFETNETDRPQESLGVVLLHSTEDQPLVVLSSPLDIQRRTRGSDDATLADTRTGEIVYVAFAPHPQDTTLPLRPSFVPLIQQLLLDIAGKREGLNLRVGQTFAIHRDDFPPSNEKDSATTDWWVDVQDPSGERVVQRRLLSLDEPSVLCQATTPGRYTVLARSSDRVDELTDNARNETTIPGEDGLGSADNATWRLAEIPAEESDLRSASESQLVAIAETLGARIFDRPESLGQDVRLQTYGREIWRPLCVVLLMALLGELFLLQIMDRRSPLRSVSA